MTPVRPVCLKPRRMAVLLALHRCSRPKPYGLGHAPTMRELGCATGISSTYVVRYNLYALARVGLTTAPPYDTARAWRVSPSLMFETVDGVTTVWERT